MTNVVRLMSKTKYKVQGLNLENFLFKLSSSGIALGKVKKKKQTLWFTASTVNSSAISAIAAEFNLKLSVLGTSGFISMLQRLPYSIGSVLGIAFSIFTVMYFTSFIDSVSYVIPTEHVCKNDDNCIFLEHNLNPIKEYISKEIAVGKRFSGSTTSLSRELIAKFNLIESCSVKRVGTKVIISLTEAEQKQPQNYTKIVAENNCIISSITTYSGKAKVKAGDIVVKGQTLVEADDGVMPRAKIIAKVYYSGMSIHYANTEVLEETGKTYTTTALTIFNKTLLKEDNCPYKMADKVVSSSYITNLLIPLKKVTVTYKELRLTSKYIEFESVKQSVMEKAKAEALKQTNGSPRECTYSIVTEGDVTRVDCYLEVLEEIGQKA